MVSQAELISNCYHPLVPDLISNFLETVPLKLLNNCLSKYRKFKWELIDPL